MHQAFCLMRFHHVGIVRVWVKFARRTEGVELAFGKSHLISDAAILDSSTLIFEHFHVSRGPLDPAHDLMVGVGTTLSAENAPNDELKHFAETQSQSKCCSADAFGPCS
jgi:hypothetical protein